MKHMPDFVVQHDYIGVDNMYIFHWTLKLLPKCSRIVMLTPFPSNENTKKFNAQFIEMAIDRYYNKLKIPRLLLLNCRT